MQSEIFKDTIKQSWISTLLWGIGAGAMMALFIALAPMMNALQLTELFNNMPPVVLAAAGLGTDLSVIGTPDGLIALGFFAKFALIFAAYPVVMGLRVITNEETDGTLDILLSLPVSRSRVIFEKFLAYSVNIVGMVLIVIGGMYAGLLIAPPMELNTGRLIVICLNLIPVMIFVLAMTIFTGAMIRRKQSVVVVMTAFVIASYMIQTVGVLVSASWMDLIEGLSFFTYYNVEKILKYGTNATHILALLLLAVVLLTGATYRFQRRDVGV
jgi:ABC-2 type transport system permease protein